jgi:hypothetical protein
MTYDTEKQRVKISRQRTRRGLQKAGYSEQEIAEIIAGVNWEVMTPARVLAEYVKYDDEDTEQPGRPFTPWEKIGLGAALAGACVIGFVVMRGAILSGGKRIVAFLSLTERQNSGLP